MKEIFERLELLNFTKGEIEKKIGMPANSLSRYWNGKAILPEKWVNPLRELAGVKADINAELGALRKENAALRAKIAELESSVIVKDLSKEPPKTNYYVGNHKPKVSWKEQVRKEKEAQKKKITEIMHEDEENDLYDAV